MIDKKISVSDQVSNLPIEAQLIFTWAIPHADDVGFLPFSLKTLKATVVPLWDCTLAQFGEWVETIVKEGLWREVEYGGVKYYAITKFREHQTLKRDRQPQILMKVPLSRMIEESWKAVFDALESVGIHVETVGIQMETELNRTELNRTEPNKNTNTRKARVGDALKDLKAKVKKIPKTVLDPALVAELIESFKVVNPNYKALYERQAQRQAIDHIAAMVNGSPEEKFQQVRRIILSLPNLNRNRYAPTITTPIELRENLGKAMWHLEKLKDSGKSKQVFE